MRKRLREGYGWCSVLTMAVLILWALYRAF